MLLHNSPSDQALFLPDIIDIETSPSGSYNSRYNSRFFPSITHDMGKNNEERKRSPTGVQSMAGIFGESNPLVFDGDSLYNFVDTNHGYSNNAHGNTQRNFDFRQNYPAGDDESQQLMQLRAKAQHQLELYEKMLQVEEQKKRGMNYPATLNRMSPLPSPIFNNFRNQHPPQEACYPASFDAPRRAPMNTQYSFAPVHQGLSRSNVGIASAGMTAPMNGIFFQVQFKTASRFFVSGSHHMINFKVTDFVIVEADRGEDLGVVTGVLSSQQYQERRQQMNGIEGANNQQVRRILRLASLAERQSLAQKHQEEQAVVKFCGQLVSSVHQLPIVVFDAEYQFDRNKLTIYYNALSRFDFRELVRDLYAAYKARIWMEKFYPPPGELNDAASMALATGVSLPVAEQTDIFF